MSILNSLIGALGSQGDGKENAGGLGRIAQIAMQNPQILAVAASMLTASNKHGGLGGLLAKFQEHGLGDVAQSWVNSGEDKPVAPGQIRDVFGEAGIERIAQKAGTSPSETPDLLAGILPALVNIITPEGHAPAQADAPKSANDLLAMLGGAGGIGGLLGNLIKR